MSNDHVHPTFQKILNTIAPNVEAAQPLFADAGVIRAAIMDVIDSRDIMDLWENCSDGGYDVTEEQANVSRNRFADRVIQRARELQSPPFSLGIKIENYCPRHMRERLPAPTASVCGDCAAERLEKKRINDPD